VSSSTAPRFRPLGGGLGGVAQLGPSFLTVLGDTLSPSLSLIWAPEGVQSAPLASARGAWAARPSLLACGPFSARGPLSALLGRDLLSWALSGPVAACGRWWARMGLCLSPRPVSAVGFHSAKENGRGLAPSAVVFAVSLRCDLHSVAADSAASSACSST
jgi:hypothetical protein